MWRHPYVWLAGLLAINVALRLPGMFQDLPPLMFDDESLYTFDPYYQMYLAGSWYPPHYLSGGMNFYPPLLLAKLWSAITGQQLSADQYVGLARVLGPLLINSASAVFIVATVAKLDRRPAAILAAAGMATLSPLILGISRIFYPDHYIIGPAAALLYICVCVARKEASVAHYLAAGALIAIAASLKYTGGMLALLFAGAYLAGNLDRGVVGLVTDIRLWRAGYVAVAVFALLNPGILVDHHRLLEALTLHRKHYMDGHTGIESAHGHLFYLLTLCLTFGVLGIVPLVTGGVTLLRRERRVAIVMLGTAALLVYVVGSYVVAINRNIMMVIPIVVTLMSIGSADLVEAARERWPGARWVVPVLALALSADPVWRDVMSLRNDFQGDSRAASQEWIAHNVPAGTPIGFSPATWGIPFDLTRNPLVRKSMPATEQPCADLYVMDDWFYQHYGPGNNPLLRPVVSEHIYINPTQMPYTQLRKRQDDFLSNYDVIKMFADRDYYGPTVTIYQRRVPCSARGKD
jgi:4-amino-4-deoxy-L-arabinose transferase-like glycosyltransferase